MKFTTFLYIRQLSCYWLLWLVVILLGLCWYEIPNSTMPTLDELMAQVVRRGDVEGPLFPWHRGHSQRRRLVRLPQWFVSLWQRWRQLRRMSGWNMAQWVDFLTRYQICKFVGAMLLLYPLLEELDVAEIVNQHCSTEGEVEHGTVVVVLALNRLIAPRPLYKIADWLGSSILPLVLDIPASKFNDDRLGRTLDAIAPHMREIWLEIVSRALERYDIELKVIFYDLTALVMMGDYEKSQVVDFGFAHNTPMDKRKVKLAGNATQDGGLLFDWTALCGKEADTATVEDNLKRLSQVLHRQKRAAEKILFVGDRAMLNNRLAMIYDAYQKQGWYYLTGLEPRTTEHQALLAAVTWDELKTHPVLGEYGHRYWGVKHKDEKTGQEQQVTHTALIVYSEATHRSWRHTRFKQLRALCTLLQEEVTNKLNQPYWRNPAVIRKRVQSRLDKSPVGTVLKVKVWGEYGTVQMRWRVDRDALHNLCGLAGRFLLVTNDPTLSAVTMLQTYKDKDRIEKQFRIAKQVLRIRPIYLHNDDRIKAMMLVNMIALLAYSLVERR